MRDPLNMRQAVSNDDTVIKIDHLPEYTEKEYDLLDEKDLHKYICDIEKICRTSFEYRQFIKFLRENIDMRKCSFYESVNNYNTFKIKIEIHHDPFDLYTICDIVKEKRICNNESLEPEIVAKEVMLLHYNLLVGLVPLSETVHELVHNQYLFVPTTSIFGFYRDFMDMYSDYISDEIKEKVARIEQATMEYDGSDKYVLDKKFIYTDVTGVYRLPKYDDIKQFLNNRISDINNGKPAPVLNVEMVEHSKDCIKLVKPPFTIKP